MINVAILGRTLKDIKEIDIPNMLDILSKDFEMSDVRYSTGKMELSTPNVHVKWYSLKQIEPMLNELDPMLFFRYLYGRFDMVYGFSEDIAVYLLANHNFSYLKENLERYPTPEWFFVCMNRPKDDPNYFEKIHEKFQKRVLNEAKTSGYLNSYLVDISFRASEEQKKLNEMLKNLNHDENDIEFYEKTILKYLSELKKAKTKDEIRFVGWKFDVMLRKFCNEKMKLVKEGEYD